MSSVVYSTDDMEKILIIIPAYNEEEALLKTYQEIIEYNKQENTRYDVIVINDCSIDQTEKLCIQYHIPYISLVHNLGIGGAVQTGYKYARDNGYDIAIQFDGDGQHDIKYVKDIIRPIINRQADLVIGSRFVEKGISTFQSSRARRVGIKIISATIRFLTGKKIHDVTSGFRAANKMVIADFAKSYPVEYPESITNTELLKKNYDIVEIPVAMNERGGGVSSIRSWKSAYFMMNVVLAVIVVGMRKFKHVK